MTNKIGFNPAQVFPMPALGWNMQETTRSMIPTKILLRCGKTHHSIPCNENAWAWQKYGESYKREIVIYPELSRPQKQVFLEKMKY